jgi:prepilin-type N-terminal cleavage/methylation domain-containing protein
MIYNSIKKNKGFTLTEIIITIALIALVVTLITIGVLNFRNNIEYDILLNKIVESLQFAKMKAVTGKWDSSGSRSSYSIKFFESRFVEFEGDTYVEGGSENIEHEIPLGLRLDPSCSPVDNGIVTFSPIEGENSNSCTIDIYKLEETTPAGSVIVGKHGVTQAS